MPGLQILLAAAAGIVAAGAWRSSRELRAWRGTDERRGRRIARAVALVGATALVALGLSRAAQEPPELSAGVADAILVIDVSRSMAAEDTAPSRLRRAIRVAEQVVEEAVDRRLGLVVFAGDAFAALPLTQDRDAVRTYLRALDTDTLSRRGSNLVRALEVAAGVFDPRSRRARHIVLLSDGEHAGPDPGDIGARLHSLGVRLVAVGFGDTAGARIPIDGAAPLRDRRGQEVSTRRVDTVLERIARRTGGSYYREAEAMPDPSALLPSVTPEAAEAGEARPESSSALLALALGLLGIELLLSLGRSDRGPRGWERSRPCRWLLSLGRRSPGLRGRGIGGRRSAVATLALVGVGAGGSAWLSGGDLELEAGRPGAALSLYRRVERQYGSSPDSRLRIGNALYRLGENDRAAAAYLDVLRELSPEDGGLRFRASFNLGDSLLRTQRFAEARDAFWGALLEAPESIEAKFNYEWASDRAPPPEPPEPLPTPGNPRESPGSGPLDAALQRLAAESLSAQPTPVDSALGRDEATRWLESLDEDVESPLRRQAAEQTGTGTAGGTRGQAW